MTGMEPLLAIDPGSKHSAWLLFDTETHKPHRFGIDNNRRLVKMLANPDQWGDFSAMPLMAVEWIESYGMAVGKSVFETCWHCGRFAQAWSSWGGEFGRVTRKQVKLHLCGNLRANDTNIRCALIDRYGADRGEAVGTVKAPGPLHGIKTHLWAALGVALTATEGKLELER